MAISLSNNNNVNDSYNKESYAKIPQVLKVPHLIQSQLDTYDWFQTDGLQDVFQEVSPIKDYTEKTQGSCSSKQAKLKSKKYLWVIFPK